MSRWLLSEQSKEGNGHRVRTDGEYLCMLILEEEGLQDEVAMDNSQETKPGDETFIKLHICKWHCIGLDDLCSKCNALGRYVTLGTTPLRGKKKI